LALTRALLNRWPMLHESIVAPEQHDILLTGPQYDLVTSNKRYPAMVAGFGAGKTEGLVIRALSLKFQYPENDIAYYLPTYDLVNTIAFPRFEELLPQYGFEYGKDFTTIKNQTPLLKIKGYGKIILRTMDRPQRIIGYEVGDSLVDELDTLKHDDAKMVWQKIMARNRQKKPGGAQNTIAVGTTPEGFKFVYEQWKNKPPNEQYQIIKASTYSNAHNLPADYIPDLIANYPTNLIQAYIDGEFVNLTAGSVYPNYDRIRNRSTEVVKPGEALHVGMDFNVNQMAAVCFGQRDGNPHAIAELVGLLDTPAMITALRLRFPNNGIYVYPDASGDNRKSQKASETDIALLRQANFIVLNNPANPRVRDRVLSMNIMLAGGPRGKLYVNDSACPAFADALEKQAYDKNGEPDKQSGQDHPNDAGGYFIHYRYPVIDGRVVKSKVGGV
jgi:hypothetical protein